MRPARRSPGARRRISTTPLSPCRCRGATRSAPSTPSCARPTTWPTTRASRARSAAAAWRMAGGLAGRLPGRGHRRSGLPRGARRHRAVCDPARLLDELVAGVAMDLDPATGGAPDTYATFAELYAYCYRVASVVGLVCIRIFGYKDPRRREAGRGDRHRLPADQHPARRRRGRGAQPRLSAAGGPEGPRGRRGVAAAPRARARRRPPSERALLADIAGRAEGYYRSARRLLPLIDPESRPALWVLVSIYHRLLKRIRRADYDVFSRRASVPLVQKLGSWPSARPAWRWRGSSFEPPGIEAARRTVTVVGGGVAGMSAACALAEAGLRVRLLERRAYLGGRASSFRHPGVGEVIDNCQHVLFGCCTNLTGFYRRIGAAGRIHWTREMTMIEPGGRRSRLCARPPLPPPFHRLPSFLAARAFSARDKLALARAFRGLLRPVPADSTESLGAWLARHGQTQGALDRFWRLVIASALNADLDSIALPYAAKVIRELFHQLGRGGQMGLSTVPLGELSRRRGGFPAAARRRASGSTPASNRRPGIQESSQWTLATPAARSRSDFLVLALPFEAMAKLAAAAAAGRRRGPARPPARAARALAHLQRASLVRPRDHRAGTRRPARPGNPLDVQQEPAPALAQGRGRLPRTGGQRRARLRRAARRGGHRPVGPRAGGIFSGRPFGAPQNAVRIKEVRATFGVPPGIDAFRPGSVSPWPNCFLAGDWTATGWPSTMESAARSGHLAAEAVCRAGRAAELS